MREPGAAPPTDEPMHQGAEGVPASTSAAAPVADDAHSRARLAEVRRERDAQLLDLGGLVFDLHRFGRRRDDLVLDKLDALLATERRRREHEAELREDRAPRRCPACTGSLLPGQEWCLECGADVLTVAAQDSAPPTDAEADGPVGTPAPAEPHDTIEVPDEDGEIHLAAMASTNGAAVSHPGDPSADAMRESGAEADGGPSPSRSGPAGRPRRPVPPVAAALPDRPRRRRVPIAIAGGALALVGVLAAVIIFAASGSDDAAKPQASTPAPVVSATGDAEAAAPVTPPEPTGPAAWPAGTEGFTVILVSTDETGATDFAQQLFDAGVTTTGVIAGEDYQDGPEGLFQTFAGRFDTQAQAQASAGRLAAKGYQGFVQEIKPPAATPASATTP